MAATPATLVRSSLLEVFGERDPDARREAAQRVFAPDVVFVDAEAAVVGIDDLLAEVEGLLGSAAPYPDDVAALSPDARTTTGVETRRAAGTR